MKYETWASDSGVRSTYSVVGFNEGVVDGDDIDVRVLDGVSEDDATDAAEAVDSDLDRRHDC